MKVLVTGSAGTIGTRLCESLLDEGVDVIGCDRVPNKWQPQVNEITKQVDLLNAHELDALPTDRDIVVHLAANARVHDLVIDPSGALENITTLFNTLEWARKNGVKKFIFASSRECYGNTDAQTFTEDMASIDRCESPYTASKIGGEAFVQSYGRCYDMDIVILRFSNVYGAYDDSDRVVPLFIRKAKKNELLTVFGEEKCLDFTYIDDAVEGVKLMIEKFDNIKGEVINLAGGEGTSIMRCAEFIKELTGSDSEITIKPPRVGEVIYYVADTSKAEKLLRFKAKYSFDEGVQKAVEWYEKHASRE